MNPKLKTGVAELVRAAKENIREVDVAELLQRHGDDKLVVVDIRDVRERQRSGFIPGSFHAPRGMLEFWVDPDSPYFKPIFGEDKEFVFYCASGGRSALTVDTLTKMGFESAHLTQGFSGWVEADGPTEMPEPRT